MPRWRQRIEEKKADVEVAKLDREHRALLEDEASERAMRSQEREEALRRAEIERQRQTQLREEKQRLSGLVQEGMRFALIAPIDYQALVRRDLISYVTSDRFPLELSEAESTALLRRRVERLLKPLWQDEQKVQHLLSDGKTYALLATMGLDWDFEPGEAARREVARVLKREIDATWTRSMSTPVLMEF